MATIYISSTFSDLQDYRRAVYDVLRQLGHDVRAMEDYVATDARPVDKCLADVAACDVYVGIFALRYGYIPPHHNPTGASITELEYRKAGEAGKPRLIFLLAKGAVWPTDRIDAMTGEGEQGRRIAALREELAREHTRSEFRAPEDLSRAVSVAVTRWEQSQAPPQASSSQPSTGGATVDVNRLAEQLAEYRQREQFLQDHIRTLTYVLSSQVGSDPDLFNAEQAVSFDSSIPQVRDYDAEAANQEEDFNQVEQLLTRGIDRGRQGDYIGAVDDFNQAINLQPEYAVAYRNRGVACAMQGHYDEAIDDFDHVIRLKPYDDLAYLYRGMAYANASQPNYDAAIKDYNEAIRLRRGRGVTYYYRGKARAAQSDYTKAIEDYDRAIDYIISPYNAPAHNDRGIAHAMQGKHDKAMADFNKAIHLQPEYDAAYHNRGRMRVAQGDYAEAIDDYEQYLELGGGPRHGNQEEVEQLIRVLQAQIDSAEWEAQQRIAVAHKEGRQALDLSFLDLTTLPESLEHLTQLTWLQLRGNRLTTLPESLGNLTQLTWLNLAGNRLMTLPASFASLTQLQELYLHDNPELGIPLEILGPTWTNVISSQASPASPADILHYYFRSREEPPRHLNEAKILLVGQGGVGKTCLVKRLVNNTFDPNEAKTEGIKIVQWTVPGVPQSNGTSEPIRLNIWDFGGQEIMHATHQFFLTQRSLYLVVLDARKGENESNMNYWLKIIQSYGSESPVLIVTNKHEPPDYLDLNERRLMLDYAPNIQGFFNVSCRDGTGLEALRTAIEAQIHALPHVSDEVPASYFRVKDELETLARRNDFIDMDAYRTLCQNRDVTTKQDQDLLLRFLHDLGNVLNFDDPAAPYELRDTNILNPEWVTGGVYKILNNNELMQAGGRLELEQLGAILDDHRRYPPERQRFIIEMMRKFELCFDFPDSQPLRLLIPELLPKNEPDLNWATAEALNFEYHYSVLPGGIIPRFIVKMHHNLTAMPTYWRSGMVLEIEGNRAFVRGDTQAGRVYISILGPGPGRRRALSVIRDAFKAIHTTIPKLDVQERVPLPRQSTVTVDYRHLLKLEALGETRFIPEGLEEPVDVRQLLDVIEPASLRQERQEHEQAFSGAPGLASRRVPPLVMQETTIPAVAEASAGDLVAIRARLDQKAKRQVKLCWFLATIAIFTCAGVLILVLGWDVIEPWTWLLGLGCALLTYCLSALTSRKFSPKAMYGRFVAIRKRQLYTELGLPGERWHDTELEDG